MKNILILLAGLSVASMSYAYSDMEEPTCYLLKDNKLVNKGKCLLTFDEIGNGATIIFNKKSYHTKRINNKDALNGKPSLYYTTDAAHLLDTKRNEGDIACDKTKEFTICSTMPDDW